MSPATRPWCNSLTRSRNRRIQLLEEYEAKGIRVPDDLIYLRDNFPMLFLALESRRELYRT